MKFISIIAILASFSFINIQASAGEKLRGTVKIDGSSTVFPISEAVAEEFQKAQPRVRVTIGVSGTGGGFKKFTNGETDINDASRPIKGKELKKAAANKIEFIELPVAYDGISVVINPKNTFAKNMTIAELHKIWAPDSKVKTWKEINASWPNEKIKLYGPGHDSGTFDFFTEIVNGKSKASRADFVASEDDNVLVRGISQDQYAMGYFGYAYYLNNKSKLKALPISPYGKKAKLDAKMKNAKAIAPDADTIEKGTYPLARPIYIYVSKASAEKPEVAAFVEFYLKNAGTLAKEVGYIPLPQKLYDQALSKFQNRKTGTKYAAK